MGNAFRQQPGPALYPENRTPFANDLLEVGFGVAFLMIFFSFLLIIPGIRGWERLWSFLRVTWTLWVGVILLVGNWSYEWHTDSACVRTQYKAYVFPINIVQEIEAEVGLHIGLRGINVTLREVPLATCLGMELEEEYERPFPGESIDYNEALRWGTGQGRNGFGRFSSNTHQDFRDLQFRGSPYPILWIAEYFTLDGEQIRWERKFRLAGWFTQILLGVALGIYFITILLFIFVIRLGAWFMLLTGLLMVFASFAYGIIIINDPELRLPFANQVEGPVFLDPHYGWSFYLVILTGIITFFLACVILLMDYFFPRKIAVVFHHSIVEEDEFFQVDDEDEEGEKPSLDEYGASTRGIRKGATTRRGGTTRRGIDRYRQTQRKPRSTVRNTGRGGSQRLNDDIQLQELPSEKQ